MTPWSKKFEKMIVIIDQEWSNHHPFYADVNDELLIETSDTKSKYFTFYINFYSASNQTRVIKRNRICKE